MKREASKLIATYRRVCAYADYVLCGCIDRTGNDVYKCEGQLYCARRDFKLRCRALRDEIRKHAPKGKPVPVKKPGRR